MPQVSQLLVEVNRRAYSLPAIVRNYALNESLDPPEQRILERYRDRIVGKSVLDLGCGTGRTTAALAALAASYDGVDIAAPMVAHCRARFAHLAHARFHVMDAASLPGFADAAFDFILFSFNGIDCMGHDGRLAVLRESRRLLRADGIFAFTTHNRGCAAIQRRPRPPPSLSPRPWASYARNLFNSLRLRRHEIATEEYEIINEQAEGFRLLCYHATAAVNARQLAAAGFRLLDVLDHEGQSIAPAGDHPDVPFLTFVATPA
ncbi:MAG: class I SAM-dependent methyltransferase [Alphaproteobacteria bacterium]|nr:class I SAM-dependent methyltransferase [Alphaproteobacteria bacterium]